MLNRALSVRYCSYKNLISKLRTEKPYDCKVTIRSRPSMILFIKERPQLNKSIDSNLIFDIAGHTLLFGRLDMVLELKEFMVMVVVHGGESGGDMVVGKRTIAVREVYLLKETEDRVIPPSSEVITVVDHTITDELNETTG
ncbi:hypothetical protein Tco_0649466, partial [Tanacetum coccineum]